MIGGALSSCKAVEAKASSLGTIGRGNLTSVVHNCTSGAMQDMWQAVTSPLPTLTEVLQEDGLGHQRSWPSTGLQWHMLLMPKPEQMIIY